MRHPARGLTLIELLVTITIVGFVMTGVVGALASQSMQGSNRMIRQQATAIAAAYLEEIVQRPVTRPPGPIPVTRAQFNTVGDYNGLPDTVVRDQQGVAIPGLAQYQVTVQVGAGNIAGIPAAATRLITVTVTHQSGVSITLNGYKAN